MIGIYKITNKINGKVYIGQSWDIEKRWANEKSGRTNNHLLKSFKKYGFENFHFEVLENLCENTPQEYLDIKEDFYILKTNSLDPNFGYNKKRGGHTGKHTQETKIKLMELNLGENNPNFGKKASEETRKKMSEIRVGDKNFFFNKKHNEETKRKISEAQSKKVICVETEIIYKSLREASKSFGLTPRSIAQAIENNWKSAGLHWKYYVI